MNNIKINQSKIIMILINEIISLKASTIATQAILIGVTKALKPEISDYVVQRLQDETEAQLKLLAPQYESLLESEGVDFEKYLASLLNQ